MGNIRDYICWRGDLSFAQSAFNEVDNLVLAVFAYINLDGIEEVQGEEGLALPELSERFFAIHTKEELEADTSFVAPVPYMMREMAKSDRFGGCVVRNYVNEIITEAQQQFAAMEIRLEDGSTYVAFRGTDDTIVGWKEDFNLSNGVVPAQQKAAKYLSRVGEGTGRMLRVGGHSKGGNLAIYASAMCPAEVQEHILEIYSNDGPGFVRGVFNGAHIDRILPRIKRIIPEASIVGMLLDHEKEPLIVKSSQKGILQHDGFSWQVLGASFVRAQELSKRALAFDGILHKWIDDMDAGQRASLIDDLFSVLEVPGVDNISQIQEGGLKSFKAILKKIEKFPPDSRIMVQELTNALLAGWIEQLRTGTQQRITGFKDSKMEEET